jgi:hypothetical protein
MAMTVTTNLDVNFMRKPDPGHLMGEWRRLRPGKTWRSATSPSGTRGERTRRPATATCSIPLRRQ